VREEEERPKKAREEGKPKPRLFVDRSMSGLKN
jgi:hypothetical protein